MWVKKRHYVVFAIVKPILYVASKLMFGFTPEKYKLEAGKPYLVLSNHQTTFDQFMVNLSFQRLLYFVATGDIYTLGFVSSIIKYLVAPISKSKAQKDAITIRNCMRVVKEGGAVCIFPEGNRTYTGCTEEIDPVIARLVKSLGATLILYNIEGGYGVEPRWMNSRRKGKMRGFVRKVISPEEIKSMSDNELYLEILRGLYVDSYEGDAIFTGDSRAEYIERALYKCADCGSLETIRSEGNTFSCSACGLTIEYGEDLRLKVKDGNYGHETVRSWYDWQANAVRNLDLDKYSESDVILSDDDVNVYLISREQPKKLLFQGRLAVYKDRFVLTNESGEETYQISDISDAVTLNKNNINIAYKDNLYKVAGVSKRFCGLKYSDFFRCIKRIRNSE